MKVKVNAKGLLIFGYCTLLLALNSAYSQSGQNFKVALDAGHGDQDYGAVYHGHIEKNITLSIALKVGKLLEKNANIDVIYTRKTDQFIDLIERANIANRADANIFVSIHCNANANISASGSETYVMGMSKNASNLEAAKRENTVITLEKDYRQKYEGYDSNSVESMTSFTKTSEEYLDNSIALAGKIQNHFIDDIGRKSRGVKQAPFIVLNKAFMPKVLVELGFISNQEDGDKLDSEEGQQETAQAIADAIISYKKENFDKKKGNDLEKPSQKIEKIKISDSAVAPKIAVKGPEVKKQEVKKADQPKEVVKPDVATNGTPSFKVQLSASGKKLDLTPSNFKGLGNISISSEGNLYKYMYGDTSNYDEAKRLLSEAKAKGYESAFIIAFINGKKVSIQEALKR